MNFRSLGTRQLICVVFVVTVCVMSVYYLKICLHKAHFKDFDSDERATFSRNVAIDRVPDMIIRGVPDQGSAAPLDYVALKFLYWLEPKVERFGLSFNAYYRLNAITVSFLSGLIVTTLFFRRTWKGNAGNAVLAGQLGILALALGFYYFWYFNIYFATQMRAYALWNSLWFMTLAFLMLDGKLTHASVVLLSLLAATSTASTFQILTLAGCYVAVKLWYRDDWPACLREVVRFFALPLFISTYYFLQGQSYHYGEENRYFQEFYGFWRQKEMVPILSVLGAWVAVLWRGGLGALTVFVVMLALYVLSPAINFLVISKGFYFSSRQYLYYDLIYPLFLLQLTLVLPTAWEWGKRFYSNNLRRLSS